MNNNQEKVQALSAFIEWQTARGKHTATRSEFSKVKSWNSICINRLGLLLFLRLLFLTFVL
jgi:hypothetical protein